MYNKAVISTKPLGFTWETSDPFLLCVHHADAYPKGNENMGPAASLAGRNLRQDFILKADGSNVLSNMALNLLADQDLVLENGEDEAHFLLLQGRPIGEPVVQFGPFVMNTQSEIQQAYTDYQKTQFGGWPWDRKDPVHSPSKRRFAKYADGNEEIRGNLPHY